MSDLSPRTESHVLRVVRWSDTYVDQRGHRITDPYVEMFWLPVLGPTATWLLRRLDSGLAINPDGLDIDMVDLAKALGVAYTDGRHNPFARALQRCIMFGAAQHIAVVPVRTVAIRQWLPVLPERHLGRLPHQLRTAHADWLHTSSSQRVAS